MPVTSWNKIGDISVRTLLLSTFHAIEPATKTGDEIVELIICVEKIESEDKNHSSLRRLALRLELWQRVQLRGRKSIEEGNDVTEVKVLHKGNDISGEAEVSKELLAKLTARSDDRGAGSYSAWITTSA